MARRSTPRERRKVLDALDVPEKFREVRSLPPKRRPGAPSIYSLELAQEFCRRVSEGELVIEICAEEGMPARSTIFDWSEALPEFAAMYARARERQAHACAERAVVSGRQASGEDAAARRVQFDADRWFAAKLLPKTYADRVNTENVQLGPDGKPVAPGATFVLKIER
jgi:hypothetical protein